jgi:predicted DNA-binding ribbon-helix-helix protein
VGRAVGEALIGRRCPRENARKIKAFNKASVILKRSVTLDGRRTSISIEAPFWEALAEIASSMDASRGELIERVNRNFYSGNLSSTLRVFVLQTCLEKGRHPKNDDQQVRTCA